MRDGAYYRNRQDAGKRLASFFNFTIEPPVLALSLPRGGTIVAAAIVESLMIDHRLIMVRKIGSPYDPEIAIGAITMDGQFIPNTRYIEALSVSHDYIETQCKLEQKELLRRLSLFTAETTLPDLSGTTVIVVDDGIATGYTIETALRWLQSYGPKKIILTVPVAAADAVSRLAPLTDLIVCPLLIHQFTAVENYYDDFSQISDNEVKHALEIAKLSRR